MVVPPVLDAGEGAVGELLQQPAHPLRLGPPQRQLILRLDQEEPRYLGRPSPPAPPRAGDGRIQRVQPPPQQADQLVRRQHGALAEGRLEPGVLTLGLADQLAQPVLQLLAPRVGDLVGGPLRLPALAGDIHGLDEAVLLQVLHHGVERTPVDLDRLILALLAQREAISYGYIGRSVSRLSSDSASRLLIFRRPVFRSLGHPASPRIRVPVSEDSFKVLVDEYRHATGPPATPRAAGAAAPASRGS